MRHQESCTAVLNCLICDGCYNRIDRFELWKMGVQVIIGDALCIRKRGTEQFDHT